MPRNKIAFAATLLCLSAALSAMATSAQARTILKGTSQSSLATKGAEDTTAKVDFLATKAHAQLLRFDLKWSRLEPQRGTYDETYLNQLQQTIHAAASDGMKVIITLSWTPRWASDQTLWSYVPSGYQPGYHTFYPPASSHLADLQAFASKLATTFGSDVFGYECRNEPNGWWGIYPQTMPSDPEFGVRRYAAMLTAFSAGIRAVDPSALVIAGGTAPFGNNTVLGTSPQRFARELKTLVNPSVFDAYSHHPYTIGGTSNIAPEAMPGNPKLTVSLGNISTLLKIFPSKPFYLTEYGYQTQYVTNFGVTISQATQAQYLQRAYKYAARFPQIKTLIWYPYQDVGPTNPTPSDAGTYSGLVTRAGVLKLSWYAFSGGNKLTLTAATTSLSAVRRLSGHLTSASLGGLSGKTLVLYRRTAGSRWRVVRNITTGTNGAYHATVKLLRTTTFKVAWLGVTRSPLLSVKR